MDEVEKAYADHMETVHGQEVDALIPRVKELERLIHDKDREILDLKKQLAISKGETADSIGS
jgi:hypothetical protein